MTFLPVVSFFFVLTAGAQEAKVTEGPGSSAEGSVLSSQVEEILVSDQDEFGPRQKKSETGSVERIQKKRWQVKQPFNLSQAIDDELGIDTQTSCAFCGAKRITINGMRSEHTTILIDGLPLHSAVSSFYAADSIPLLGLEAIDVARGSGAALTAIESIAGTLNLVTRDPFFESRELSLTVFSDDQKNLSARFSKQFEGKWAFLVGFQASEISSLDLDKNNVTEVPYQESQSAMLKLGAHFDQKQELSLRVSHSEMMNIGGNPHRLKLQGPNSSQAGSVDFVDTDVRNDFIGDPRLITDHVDFTRSEIAFQYQKTFSNDLILKASLAEALQNQDSVFSHGYDYRSDDRLQYSGVEFQLFTQENHFLTWGFDHRYQRMKSQSDVLYDQQNFQPDSLRSSITGFYFHDLWSLNDQQELSTVIRFDQIRSRWLGLNRSLTDHLVIPRFFFKHSHDSFWTSRWGYGKGYRSPLTLFETQHGTQHEGFLVAIDQPEKSQSFTYSLNAQWHDDFFSTSWHHTLIENMAYGQDRASLNLPTQFLNSKRTYQIHVFDISYGRRIDPNWDFEVLAEKYQFQRGYKEKLPVAAIEGRLSLLANWQKNKWKVSQRLILVPKQNLSPYGYSDHYNRAQEDTDPLSPSFGEVFYSNPKRQKAPTYFTFDFDVQKELSPKSFFLFGVRNLFDYTQTRAGDSPLTWARHGDHFHLDNFHIWGPLRGRQLWVSWRGGFE